MTADADFFFSMGFFLRNEDEWDNLLGGGVTVIIDFGPAGWSGPYSHVVSQSLSQFKDSGEMVLRRCFDFIHVLHEAFSNLVLLLISFLRWTM